MPRAANIQLKSYHLLNNKKYTYKIIMDRFYLFNTTLPPKESISKDLQYL